MSAKTQGYLYLLVTMLIWGSFTLLSRLSAQQAFSPWDITALRFSLAFVILMPILLYKKDYAFLLSWKAVILALVGGVGYCLTVYSAFTLSPAAHAAIWLNGCIPLCTALAAWMLMKQPFDRNTWISLGFMGIGLAAMSYLLLQQSTAAFGLGDVLFFCGAIWWGIFTILLKKWPLTAWQSMCSVAIWSAVIFVPIYLLFLPKTLLQAAPLHIVMQGIFHGIFVVIVATLTYIAAIERLGAFKTGSILSLAPFIAAIVAVPLLHEPLNLAVVCGLIGMGIGALQPWRWFRSA